LRTRRVASIHQSPSPHRKTKRQREKNSTGPKSWVSGEKWAFAEKGSSPDGELSRREGEGARGRPNNEPGPHAKIYTQQLGGGRKIQGEEVEPG